MAQPDDGGPAFPVGSAYAGMTLRQWYAGMALQGLIPIIGIPEDRQPDELWNRATAKEAFALADAMVKVGEQP